VAACLAALSSSASTSPAVASVSIGQLAPNPSTVCSSPVIQDYLQPTVTSGNAYVVPANGTITSWSHNANPIASQMLAFKVFRQVTGLTYMAVGHDGPRPLAPGTVNTFSDLSIPVKAGDIIGLNKPVGGPACIFGVPGESYLQRDGNLADGQPGDFTMNSDSRVNIAATVVPSNAFTVAGTKRNKKRGTATLTVDVPNAGDLVLSGKGVKTQRAGRGAVASKTVTAAGTVKLLIKAKGKKKRKLNTTGKVKVNPKVTYTPTGGDPSTQSKKLKLKKRHKKR
jgi:hypothetical protein